MITILLNDFKKAINSGLGSAIMELKESKDNKMYEDAILYASLNNTCYDPYCEDERCDYLYNAIKLIGNTNFFEDKIIEKFFKSTSFWTIKQLSGILCLFGKEGSKKSIDALKDKFNEYLIDLSQKRINPNDEIIIKYAEILTIRLCEFYKMKYLLKYAENIGQIIKENNGKVLFSYDDLLNYSYEKFGESIVLNTLKKKAEKSDNIKNFLDKILLDEINRKKSLESKDNLKITYHTLINLSETSNDDYLRTLSAKASMSYKDIEILQAADRFKTEKNPKTIYALLIFFIFIDYPYNITDILNKYETSNDEAFKSICLEALSRYKDKRLHDIAIENLRNNFLVRESLGLLIKNFNNDYSYILDVVENYKENPKYDFHSLVLQIIKIFQNRKCKNAFDILSFTYRKNKCSCCRTYLIEIMCKNEIITDEILEECLNDSSEETRTIIESYKKALH